MGLSERANPRVGSFHISRGHIRIFVAEIKATMDPRSLFPLSLFGHS